MNGKLDLAVTSFYGPFLYILMGNGDGTFYPQTALTVGLNSVVYSLAVADFNLDGVPDLAVTDNVSGTVTIFLGWGDGTFGAPGSSIISANSGPYYGEDGLDDYNYNGPESVVVGDFSGDGIPSVAVVSSGAGCQYGVGCSGVGLQLPSTVSIIQTNGHWYRSCGKRNT
jgi:hypothetical protein